MKTTIDLPEDLLIEAKREAVRRGITFEELVIHSLRREIGRDSPRAHLEGTIYEMSQSGLPRLKRRPGQEPITSEMIYDMLEEGG